MSTLDDFIDHERRLRRLETQEIGVAAAGGITLIEEILPTGETLTFSSIPATYRHLRLIWVAHRDGTAIGETIHAQFNGDTSSSYMSLRHNAIAGSSGADIHQLADSNGLSAFIAIGEVASDHASWDAAHAGFGILEIPYYKNATFYTSVLGLHGSFVNNNTGMQHTLISATWEDASPVTSIKIEGGAANDFKTGSSFSLYGIT